VAAGARRFVFISSIKVNGEQTDGRPPFSADEPAAAKDPYGVSKHEAEQALFALARETGLDVVVIRPVLVYGPGVKANFQALMRWLARGVPLPLGAINNQRSLVALDNLVSLITTCIEHPAAANQVFLAADGHDLSTTALLQGLGLALGRPARLWPVPVALLRLGARVVGREAVYQRLCGSLQVDVSKARELLGWQPVIGVQEALDKTARHFLDRIQ
jgi:UDP-glucose 4-epimerase